MSGDIGTSIVSIAICFWTVVHRGSLEKIEFTTEEKSSIQVFPIQWAIISSSKMLSISICAILSVISILAVCAGIHSAMSDGTFTTLALGLLAATATYQYTLKPYSLVLSTVGVYWKGHSWNHRDVKISIDRVNSVVKLNVQSATQRQLVSIAVADVKDIEQRIARYLDN